LLEGLEVVGLHLAISFSTPHLPHVATFDGIYSRPS
jgi:hypothetical protein